MIVSDDYHIRFRFINAQCYEFALPNGKHIITDPFFTPKSLEGFRPFTLSEIERCDYILLTHAHFDHTADVGALCETFHAKVFVGEMSLLTLAQTYDIDVSLLSPMSHMQHFELSDFSFTCVRGKHFGNYPKGSFKTLMEKDSPRKLFGIPGYAHLSPLGFLETYDFCITFPNNLRLMFVSGTPNAMQNIVSMAKDFAPNVLIRHSAGSLAPEQYADHVHQFHAQYVLPCHHDNLYNGKWKITMDEYAERTQAELKRLGSFSEFIVPEPYRWYDLSLSILASDR